MPRTKKQLEDSRDILQYAVQRLQKETTLAISKIEAEIEKINVELEELRQPTKLDENFFWHTVFPFLSGAPAGVTSSHLGRHIASRGFAVSSGNLRTAVSRWGKRGLLIPGTGSNPKWRLSSEALANAPASKQS